MTKLIADSGADGLLVTEGEARIIYANDAYMTLCGAHDPSDLRTVERLFSGASDVSEAIYRLAQSAREAVERYGLDYGSSPVGAYSEVRCLPADRLLKLPDSLSCRTGAAMMLQGLTAAYLLRHTFPVKRGDQILIHAAAGGVGLIACQ